MVLLIIVFEVGEEKKSPEISIFRWKNLSQGLDTLTAELHSHRV